MDTSDIEKLPEPQIVADVRAVSALTREHHPLSFGRLESLLPRFSPAERLLLYVFSLALGLSALVLLVDLNTAISSEVPTMGGTFVEGETGPARFINPVLAISEPDQDLSQLVYSGLMRVTPEGAYTPDLAESYNISQDGTIYTFTLRTDAKFHDGEPVTADDVLYTVGLAQNPDFKSPHRADWEGVTVTSPNPHTVVFTLPHAYAPFMEDTTIGILPKHLWQSVQADSFPFSQLNTHPIGSGPYRVDDVKTDATGAPTRYDLVPFGDFTLGRAYLSRISFAFFPNEAALQKAFAGGLVDAVAGVTPSLLASYDRSGAGMIVSPLPRVFGIFFNQNHNAVLTDSNVRLALDQAIDKQAIVEKVLHGYGVVLDGPIPPGIIDKRAPATVQAITESKATASTTPGFTGRDLAIASLKKGGWTLSSTTAMWMKKIPKSGTTPASTQALTLRLATADEPELVATANMVADTWRAIGIDVDVQVYPLSDFNNTVLRPRNYDAILFGEVVSRSGDLFAFWHSSQRNDPGLNLALYANSQTDTLLTKARASSSKEERENYYKQFISIIQKDRPALFLYSPDFIYIVPTKIHGIALGALTAASERFLNVYQWYADMERVWNFFVR